MSDYNGWKNRETWNVALWLNNTEYLYRNALVYIKDNSKHASPYKGFIKYMQTMGNLGKITGDGVLWLEPTLDYESLNKMIKEME